MGKRVSTAKWNEKKQSWQINVQKDGVRKSFYSGTKGRNGQRECNRKADDWLDDNITNQNVKVLNLSQDYLEEKQLNVGTSRYKNLQSIFNKWINSYLGKKKVANLSEQDLQDVLNEMYKKDMSYKRIQETKIAMCDFIKFARKNNITRLFPENLTVNKNAKKGTRNILNTDDINILFESDKTMKFEKEIKDEYINIYRFLVLTGLRRGELLGLKWSDIYNNTIHIKRSVNEYKEVTEGKTENAQRKVPLTPLAKEVLENVQKNPHHTKYIFNFDDLSFVPSSITFRFKIYAEYNKLSAHKIHELRHTFISLTDNHLPLNTLKNIVGHSKSMNTVGVYGHETDGEFEKANIIINDKFKDIIGNKLN